MRSLAADELLDGKYTILGRPPLEALKADVAVISDTGQFALAAQQSPTV